MSVSSNFFDLLLHPGKMSVSMTKGEGVTMFTLTFDPQSNLPPLCQILRALCYSPVCCSVSKHMKSAGGKSQTLLGVSIMNMFALIWKYWKMSASERVCVSVRSAAIAVAGLLVCDPKWLVGLFVTLQRWSKWWFSIKTSVQNTK